MLQTAEAVRTALGCGGSGCDCARPGVLTHCPAHADSTPSLSVKSGTTVAIVVHCHAGCDQERVIAALEERGLWERRERSTPSDSTATVQPDCTLEAYAAWKHLPVEFLRQLGLRDTKHQDDPAIRVPYLGTSGEELAVRFRVGLWTEPRFRWKSGARLQLYGLDALDSIRDKGYVVFVEGESDVHVARFHGLPALGVPGASNFREDRDAPHLADIDIFVVVEPDKGGESLVDALARSSARERVQLVRLTDAKDLAELHVADPDRFLARWEAARAEAVPLAWELMRRARERREAAAEEAAVLIREPDILECFLGDLRRSGLVGEERTASILFLALVSRLLDKPVSVAVKGPSSAGKSFVVESTLRFFPEPAYYPLSGMSEHALAYGTEPLVHRHLVLYEAAGMSSDFATYLLRSLLSEGRVRYETVVKTREGLEPRLIEREGPTGLIVTTTAISLHPENETRLLSLPVTDTNEQTAAVLRALAGGSGAPVHYGRWHALQEWLAGGPSEVAIPYAVELAGLVPPVAVRLRRDFGAVLNLVRAHALLHQGTRELDADGRVVATIDDYAVIRRLVCDLVSDGVGASVSDTVRETVAAVGELVRDGAETNNTEVAKVLGLDKSAAQRRVRAATEAGHVRNLEERRGRPARLVLGEPLPDAVEILPLPERLHGCSENGGGHTLSPAVEGVPVSVTEGGFEVVL